jgi:hypothetical protein
MSGKLQGLRDNEIFYRSSARCPGLAIRAHLGCAWRFYRFRDEAYGTSEREAPFDPVFGLVSGPDFKSGRKGLKENWASAPPVPACRGAMAHPARNACPDNPLRNQVMSQKATNRLDHILPQAISTASRIRRLHGMRQPTERHIQRRLCEVLAQIPGLLLYRRTTGRDSEVLRVFRPIYQRKCYRSSIQERNL